MQSYEAEIVKVSRFGRVMQAQTHRKLLGTAKLFFHWAVRRNYARTNPFTYIRPVGKPRVGKEQLRIDEARRLTQVLVRAAEQGEEGEVATYTQLVLGLRSGEVLNREMRDLDDSGRVLWIPSGKTDNSCRRLDVPEPLRGFLLAQAPGKPSARLLFGSDRAQPHHPIWQWQQLRKYCRRAGLQRVCPHSLRRLHSRLAIAAGCTSRPAQPPSLLQQLRALAPQELAELLRMLSCGEGLASPCFRFPESFQRPI